MINTLYREAAGGDPRGYLLYTEEQNVSADIIGLPRAAAMIEGHETHTRTADVTIDLQKAGEISGKGKMPTDLGGMLTVAITQAVIYGWYDNELGSYVNMLGDRIVSMAEVL